MLKTNRKKYPAILFLGLVGILSMVFRVEVLGAVDVYDFRGRGVEQGAVIEWSTGSEADIIGFYVQRSNLEDGSFIRVSSFMDATGGTAGTSYDFTDSNLVNGVGYWYRLEAIGIDVDNIEFFGPIEVIAGIPAISTPSSTPTATLTSTPTLTVNRTATRTATRSPTRTRTPVRTPTQSSQITLFSATPLFRASPTIRVSNPVIQGTSQSGVAPLTNLTDGLQATQIITPTATLIPLPELTIEFPTQPAGSNIRQVETDLEKPAEKPINSFMNSIPRLGILVFIILIWIFLGGWFYFSSRRLQ